jgi:2-dehydropantoate 2-reductase
MEIIVVGAGALGSLVGGLLSETEDVHLLGRGPHIEAIRSNGLTLTGLTEREIELPASDNTRDMPTNPDVMIFTVKAYNTREAARVTHDLAGPRTRVLTLSNGLCNTEILQDEFGVHRTIAGVTSTAANRIDDGIVVHAGKGLTVIGRPDGSIDDDVLEIAGVLRHASPIETSDNMCGVLHQKAIANAAINPLTAINGIPNGQLLEREGLREKMEAIVAEGSEVTGARGVALPSGDILEYVLGIVKNTARNRSSMLQDIEKCRPTEIDYINGAFCQYGREVGVPTPVNLEIVRAVHDIESKFE